MDDKQRILKLENGTDTARWAAKRINELEAKANAWNRVWQQLKDNPLIDTVTKEHAQNGNYSAASILIDAFERAYEKSCEVEDKY